MFWYIWTTSHHPYWSHVTNYTGVRMGAIVQLWWRPLHTSISSSNVSSTITLVFISQWKDVTRSINTSHTTSFLKAIHRPSHGIEYKHCEGTIKTICCLVSLLIILLYKLSYHNIIYVQLQPCQELHWDWGIRLGWVELSIVTFIEALKVVDKWKILT